ncbi:hypothetical protein H2201_007234 [Coniosporium apollinis]|uniref:Uncharacterized protein n=2 Tax=Coniosporium TaxID=2810619 RepID=A0ABQ9NMB1_9PEZI|nr:hypothetical protein H2199_002051 [Cladosporium sp. JES 115]KAJ9659798.1 hypothetical protein H2201_007234 [Coniosporium apollinis]
MNRRIDPRLPDPVLRQRILSNAAFLYWQYATFDLVTYRSSLHDSFGAAVVARGEVHNEWTTIHVAESVILHRNAFESLLAELEKEVERKVKIVHRREILRDEVLEGYL